MTAPLTACLRSRCNRLPFLALVPSFVAVTLFAQQAPTQPTPTQQTQTQQTQTPKPGETTPAKEEKAVEMEELVVEGSLLGKARAQELQRQSTNLVNVVSSDSMGTFPDINAAEALARLPGVSIVRSDGEGRFVTIRGAKPNFNGVLMKPSRGFSARAV